MKLFNRFAKKVLASVALVVAVAGISSVGFAGFGPDRPTRVYNGAGTPGFDYPVFNSFTNVPGYGDERNFFTGAYPGGGPLTDPLAEVKQDDELTLQILVHNNADPKYNADGSGFARNTNVRVALPTGLAKSHQATAYITASNTNPTQIFDTLDFGSYNGGFFELDYIEGSASVRGNYINTVVSDAIVGNGVAVGTRALDGVVEGCFGEEVVVTLKVKVKMPHYTLRKEVKRLTAEGQPADTYATTKNASINDTLRYRMAFKNIGASALNNVAFLDEVPENMTVVPGSVYVEVPQANPVGRAIPDSAIQSNGRTVELNLGSYLALTDKAARDAYIADENVADAWVYFDARINRNTDNLCGTVTMTNKAYVRPEGLIWISNTADTIVDTGKVCDEPENPVYVCTDVTATKLGARKVRLNVSVNGAPANRVVLRSFEYNFGDGSTPLVSNSNPVEYTYAKDGTYKISVKVTFAVDGVDQTVTSDACGEVVNFTVNPPKELPNTGAGSLIGIFGAVTAAGMFISRRLALRK